MRVEGAGFRVWGFEVRRDLSGKGAAHDQPVSNQMPHEEGTPHTV